MSIETESILMKLTRAINEKNFEDEDELEDFVDQFMLKYNEERIFGSIGKARPISQCNQRSGGIIMP